MEIGLRGVLGLEKNSMPNRSAGRTILRFLQTATIC